MWNTLEEISETYHEKGDDHEWTKDVRVTTNDERKKEHGCYVGAAWPDKSDCRRFGSVLLAVFLSASPAGLGLRIAWNLGFVIMSGRFLLATTTVMSGIIMVQVRMVASMEKRMKSMVKRATRTLLESAKRLLLAKL
jgi:hypothetical protein